MSVYKRGSVWWVSVSVGGQQIRQSARTTSKAEAQKLEARLRLQGKPSQSLEAALVKYLEGEALQLKHQNTVTSVAKAVRPYIEGKTFDDIPAIVDRMKTEMKARGLTNSTINRRLACLRRLQNCALAWGWPVENRKIRLLPENEPRSEYLGADEVRRLSLHLDPVHAAFIRLAAFTGLRRGELFALTRNDIQDGCLIVRHSKTGKPRTVPVPQVAIDCLDYIPFQVTGWTLRREFEKAREAIGMPHIRFHDLRHTYASFLAQAGVSERIMMELLGHTSAQMTKRYSHLRTDTLRQVVGEVFR